MEVGLVPFARHEAFRRLLDLVADLRASTPTDAAKRVVPDVTEERARVAQARSRARAALTHRLAREEAGLAHWRSRPVLARPETLVDPHEHALHRQTARGRAVLDAALARAATTTARLAGQVRALSPAATLERGYAVVQRADGHVVRSPHDVSAGDRLRVRVAEGELAAEVSGT